MNYFFKNTDNAPLVVFRMLFGFLTACESFGAIITGWVHSVLIEPQFTFSFIGFEWLQPLPENGMYYYFAVMGVLGICIMLGYRYVMAVSLFTVLWAGVYFMQKTSYNNHYYLLLVVSFMMIFAPANREKSLDVKFGLVNKQTHSPFWTKAVFMILITMVYTYAALAKFYPDWLNGIFIKDLLSYPPLFDDFSPQWLKDLFSNTSFCLFVSYMGIAFDLLIVPCLLWKKTRIWAVIASFVFHLFNAVTLQIGIFPFFALAYSLFFFEPKTIRKVFFRETLPDTDTETYSKNKKALLYYIYVPLLIVQFLLPARHHFIEGNVLWTEEGHRLSWRMMLRSRSGYINIKVVDNKTKETEYYNYRKNLTDKQADRLPTHPDLIWQYCQRIKKEYKNRDISIYIDCKNAINIHSYKRLIDPDYDMAKAKWDYFFHNEWILIHDDFDK